MPIPVEVVTIDSLPTAVIAETISWEQFPSVWPKLLDEVYALVRGCRDFAGLDSTTPTWQNGRLYRHQRPPVETRAPASWRPRSPTCFADYRLNPPTHAQWSGSCRASNPSRRRSASHSCTP